MSNYPTDLTGKRWQVTKNIVGNKEPQIQLTNATNQFKDAKKILDGV